MKCRSTTEPAERTFKKAASRSGKDQVKLLFNNIYFTHYGLFFFSKKRTLDCGVRKRRFILQQTLYLNP